MSEEDVREAVSRYYGFVREPHHRYRSWEHCYRFFYKRSDLDKDIACLHLAFYLASWGMLRGSARLLQKDYRIHEKAVDLILSPRYDCLLGLSLFNARGSQDALFEIIFRLRELYQRLLGKDDNNNPSDTLVTKVLLGTLGCIPAYDRFFIKGLRRVGLHYSNLRIGNFKEFVNYCDERRDYFELAQLEVNKIAQEEGVIYPIMKVIDMYFWMRGAKPDR